MFSPAFVIKLYASFLVQHYSSKGSKGQLFYIVFLISCLWFLCLDICGRTVKLSFLSYGLKGVHRTTVGNKHCWEVTVVRPTVTYVMTSLKLFSFPNDENRLFSLVMLDNDYWATEIIWRHLETD